MTRLRSAAAALVIASVIGLGCGGDSAGPGGSGLHRLTLGDTAGFSFPAGDSIVYFMHVPASGTAALYLFSTGALMGVEARDSVTGVSLGGAVSAVAPFVLLQGSGTGFAVEGGQVLRLRVKTEGAPGTGRIFAAVTSDAPESRPDTISVGTVYESESLALPSDSDDFHFQAQAGHGYALYLQPIDHPDPSPFEAFVDGQEPLHVALTLTHEAGTLDANSTPAFASTVSGPVTINVHYRRDGLSDTPAIPGAYRFEIREVSGAPESGDTVLTAGDTLQSSLEYSGDFDRFAIDAQVGDTVTLFGQMLIDPFPGALLFTIEPPSGEGGTTAVADLGNGNAGKTMTTPVVITIPGTYHAAVSGIPSETHASYRLAIEVHHPSPAPPR